MSETQFARAVNRVAAESGVTLRYDQPSVNQWLTGSVPRAAARPFVAEALARRLGRPVTAAELGFPAPRSPKDNHASPGTVEGLVDLGRTDMDPSRRGVLNAGLFSVALTIPEWPDVIGRMESVRTGRSQRIGLPEVQMVEAMTARLSDLDDDFGGRHARPMASSFLVNTVAPYLQAPASSAVRQSMMSAASFLCYVTGWMAVDEGLHGLAQRYYVKALELAGAGEDHSTYCHVLRGMSVQAAGLGQGPAAARLADAASAAAPTAGHRMRAFLSGQQAHAYALMNDRAAALRAIRDTEVAIDKAQSQSGTFGGYSAATLAYHTAQVRYSLGDVVGSVSSLQLHFRLREANDRRRSSVLFSSYLAERQLEMGHLEAACATWGHVLDEYPLVHSGRADERVAAMKSRLRPYLTNRTARALYERAHAETGGRPATA
ncbi:tetratricopeptide repeat protein [Streptomyces sp. NBC_01803]|uniref:tetratricopeptide repeat protein n=1 Tax=Streptomyces sp. NBC_01803 TaxID=2975946 RepID=UPI002DDB7BCE|nr:tetratricopeptide repeat protein [Streptomyces sp. NBC_01803]WSA43493.1 tetratricopeptide repeat protein [Streptomyces sp. NBC_01803]